MLQGRVFAGPKSFHTTLFEHQALSHELLQSRNVALTTCIITIIVSSVPVCLCNRVACTPVTPTYILLCTMPLALILGAKTNSAPIGLKHNDKTGKRAYRRQTTTPNPPPYPKPTHTTRTRITRAVSVVPENRLNVSAGLSPLLHPCVGPALAVCCPFVRQIRSKTQGTHKHTSTHTHTHKASPVFPKSYLPTSHAKAHGVP